MEGTQKKKNADQGRWKGLEKFIFFARSPFSPKSVSKLHKQTLFSEIFFQT